MSKRIFLAHNSCLNSAYDMNVLEAGLSQGEFEIVDRPELADEIVFAGCSVREHWVDDAVNQISEARRRAPNAKVTITGCLANTSAQSVQQKLPEYSLRFQPMREILHSRTQLEFAEVDRALSQNSSFRFESGGDEGLRNLRQRIGPAKAAVVATLQEIDRRLSTEFERQYRRTTKGFVFYDEVDPSEMITVTRSCLYRCSFCNIPQGRGAFESVPLPDILAKAVAALKQGKRHLVLIGDEVGNYGVDKGNTRLPELLETLLGLHPDLNLSIRYVEPKPFLKYERQLLTWSMAGRIRLLYLSLQSGSQKILRGMNRGYDITRVAKSLASFRNSTETILYGNWLVGFPGEDEDDFNSTLALVEELNFHINVAIPFSARPGTPAMEMADQIDEEVKADRVTRLTALITRLKVSAMARALLDLSFQERSELIELIQQAEIEQYAPMQQENET